MNARPQVVVLAGGLGTRMQGLIPDLPKALIEVGGEPFIFHQLRLLAKNGFRRVLVCVGHLGERIEEILGEGSSLGLEVSYSRAEKDNLLGTAGALKAAEPLLDSVFMLIYGDSYLDFNYKNFIRTFFQLDCDILLAIYRNFGKYDASNIIELDGGYILYDKNNPHPEMSYIDYGAAIFRRNILSRVPAGERSDLADFYQRLSRERKIMGYRTPRRFFEIGSPPGLRDFKLFIQASQEKNK